MCAAVVAGCDAAPVLEFAEHVFDPVAQLVEAFVIAELDDAIAFRRDAGLDVLGGERISERVAVVALMSLK